MQPVQQESCQTGRKVAGVFLTTSPDETYELGRGLGLRLATGDVVALIGELGSGKTCLIQGLCAGLEVEDDVTSPTFVLINQYQGRTTVYHFDLYRIDDAGALLDLGYDDYLYGGEGVCLIEWADKFPDFLPASCIELRIEILGDEQRVITAMRV
ncbi:MAG: tRNA (adenosine(37)-N6)-threonylcarbamoyltransferase complex ATPase subunit type 1 TsaE [Candidatus Latescibacteria bacterium]|nr:tRNA (adenosine(37)-N6)-threonylcarbamoyltransferase complex ATPase subunit type 1 TsaE [Candidatus Latescibacterota bacterium]